ncbi:MAG: DNA repair protein RadC [Sorangiineae bacterium]|nr:DNA repair protein RadC [Polyangiaceae bacterium]MEB2325041.1 DNA repair protein RadC [Sorangiineae bacterium]
MSPASSSRSAPELRRRALAQGIDALDDAELVALLIIAPRAAGSALSRGRRLLDEAGGLTGLTRLGALGLSERRELGVAEAVRVAAALELGRRSLLALCSDQRPILGSFEAVLRWAEPRLSTLEHEEVWLLGLDGRNGLKSARRVAQGGLHGCALGPRDVLRPALRDGASAIVLVHNHPSGDPTPSPEDVRMTRALAEACEAVGVALLDHVVVARGGGASLFDSELGA